MKLTTKAQYAVTAMLDVAMNQQTQPVAIIDISKRQDISQSYLEQLFARLRRDALVTSVRGPGGGYRLARPAMDITVAEIISAIDDPTGADAEQTKTSKRCLKQKVWTDLNDVITNFLGNVSLEELMEQTDAAKEPVMAPTFTQFARANGNTNAHEPAMAEQE
jgi:Rrf2 family transcriptional regulator, iron-sulfur cluster assembly transcription factor